MRNHAAESAALVAAAGLMARSLDQHAPERKHHDDHE
jgi:hypothetical protein